MTGQADAATLARLHAACFTHPRPWSAAEFQALLADPAVFLETAEGHAGFALGRAAAGEAELLTLAVDPLFRRRGIGGTLLAAFEAAARGRDAETAFLEVAEDNLPARALYAAAGYAETGRRPGYYRRADGGTVSALVLRRQLG